jgi:hypothetical protein
MPIGLLRQPAPPSAAALRSKSGSADMTITGISVQRRLSAIRYAHLISGHATPTTDLYVRGVLDGIRRVKGTRPRQAQAATLNPLCAMLTTLPNDLSRMRDRALLLVGGFRRSARSSAPRRYLVRA